MKETTLKSELKYHGKILDIYQDEVELTTGRQSLREVARKSDAVAVVALHDDKIIMVEQWRYAVAKPLLEIPAGKLEDDEDPLDCAKRELEEETGYAANVWQNLGFIYPSAGFLDERIHLFLATELEQKGAHPDEGEILEVYEIPVNEIKELSIDDAKTICALSRANVY